VHTELGRSQVEVQRCTLEEEAEEDEEEDNSSDKN